MSERKDFSLTNGGRGEKIRVDREDLIWIPCPACGSDKLVRVKPTTKGVDIPAYCKRCRKFVYVNIDLQ